MGEFLLGAVSGLAMHVYFALLCTSMFQAGTQFVSLGDGYLSISVYLSGSVYHFGSCMQSR